MTRLYMRQDRRQSECRRYRIYEPLFIMSSCYTSTPNIVDSKQRERVARKKNEIKIVREGDINYTFLDTDSVNINRDSGDDNVNKSGSNIEKDIIKTRSLDSKKSKVRRKNRITGGHNQQGHSSVYE